MADRLHLQAEHRRVLEALLRQHVPDVEVWAYGSRVTCRSHDGSDLDLVLRGPGLEKIPAGRLADFAEALRESTIPILVEARDWARLPEPFQREIERDYVVIGHRRTPESKRRGPARADPDRSTPPPSPAATPPGGGRQADGIEDAHREAIIATIAANDRVERAVLFGSRATGTHTVTSDVDIALFGDRLTLTDQVRIAAALDEIPMAQSVDLLLYNSIQDQTLREHIRREGVDWYVRSQR